MEKKLQARLKEVPIVAATLNADFNKDWISASAMVDDVKRSLFHQLKTNLHERISTLGLDDIEFKIIS